LRIVCEVVGEAVEKVGDDVPRGQPLA